MLYFLLSLKCNIFCIERFSAKSAVSSLYCLATCLEVLLMATTESRITVASRIDRLPLSSIHRRLTFVLGVGTFFDLYDIFLGGLLGAVLVGPFHLTTLETALIISSGFMGMFVGAVVLGVVSDYIGRRAMYMINLLIYSLFSLAAAFAPSFLWIVIFRSEE